MPYELEKEKLSQKLLNGTQIAILLSLGLHLFIYKYGFPVSLFQESASNGDRFVSSVELSPLEQSRLPDLDAQWSLPVPQFNSTSLDEAAPPFALPLPPNFTPTDGLPPVLIPPDYTFPNIPPISSDIELPPLGITDLSALPLPPPIEDKKSIVPPKAPLTTPEAPTEEKPPAEKVTPPPEVKPKSETPESDKPTPEQIAAVREQKLKGDLRAVSRSLQKLDGATTDEEARKNYVNWLAKIENVEPESVSIEGIYPKDACIRRLEGTSVYGVIVNAENQVVALELIKGAEYPLFNEKASEDIQNHDFANETKEILPYQVTVDYEYDAEICPSLTLPSIQKKEAESTPKPATESKPATEGEATPEETETESQPATEGEATPEATETESQPATEGEATPEETETESQPETEGEATPEATEEETKPKPSLRDRLRSVPLPDDNSIRERLRKNPLPKSQ